MRVHLMWIVLLFSAYRARCSDAEQEKKTTEEELLSSLFASKVSGQSAPFWRGTLRSVCELLGRLNRPLPEDDGGLGVAERGSSLSRMPQEIRNIQDLCRMLFPWEFFPSGPEFPDPDQTESEGLLKRKSPYILKRQLHRSQARRPYILKRMASY